MISSGGSKFHSEEPVEFPHEFRYKLWTTIQHDLSGQAMVLPDMLKEELGGSSCGEGRDSRNEMSSFSDGVDGNHDGVIPGRLRQFNNEVHADCVPRSIHNRERVEFSSWGTAEGFSPEAHVTSRDILSNILRHVRPPVVSGYQFQGFLTIAMSSYPRIVTEGHDLPPEVGCIRNVDLALEVENPIHQRPLW